jgi:eukaryotic-like serine/threonine-protein kinase
VSNAAAAPPLEPNARVAGKLRLRRRLATGGMGEVWIARNESTGADVAIKVLRRGAGLTEEAETAERFRNEARLSAMLSHRSIVKVFDLVEDPWGSVLVMELLRGETLQGYLRRTGPLVARDAVAVLSPILGALAHAHERGIVHRDVTPANIFLAVDPDGHVTPKLLDFGIAKLASGAAPPDAAVQPVETLDGRVLGTPRYMAPERIRGEPAVDGRADVFSAAVVLYEALTGTCPFAASTPTGSLAAVIEQQVDPDPRIDPRLWIEIRRALSKRPYERHVTAKELAGALRASLGETEGVLEEGLKLIEPAQGWDEAQRSLGDEPRPDHAATAGQGVVVLPRKRPSSVTWVLAGLLAGGLVGLVAFELRSPGETPSTSPQGPAATTPAPSVDTVTAPPSAPVVPTAPPSATALAPPSAATSAPRATSPRGPVRTKPVATTPGF